MARGGSRGKRTSYVRDNGGRFASAPGGGSSKRSTPAARRAAKPKATGGTLGARGSLRRSRAKLAAKDPADRSLRGSLSLRAQRGAVTRGANRLGKARAASTVRMAARAGVIRKGGKVAANPVAAAKSSVRVIRPNRPAMRPGPTPDRGKISEYVDAVRGARRRLISAKPGTANAAEAKQGLKDNRQALSRRIQRERGALRGLKPANSQQVLTGTVPAPPARRVKAARVAGTVVKSKGLKPDRWIKKERVIGKGEVWMGKWTPPSGGKVKRRKPSAEPAKPTKAERVIARIEGNQARGSTVARSKKEDRRLARTLAISQFAKSYLSNRAVGNRDPNKQYAKADLLPQLNRALSRPTPRRQTKSTRSNDPEKGLISLAVGAALKTRAKYRAEGRLLPARKPRRKP